ncbi:MFS transporter [Pseudomonas sp. CGJS7]|uniref:MFS transporter n=1 Tax=Pseudomonas sp. CGJS7 TaxID=3109348 RepID=UPI003009E814
MDVRSTLRDLTLMSASTITIIGTTVIAASLPQMTVAYAAEPHSAYLVKVALTLPALAAAISALFTGWAIDRWGRKPILIAALALYGVAGASGFFIESLHLLLLSRFALGWSIAAIMACATTLIADYAQRAKLGGAMGRQSLFMALGNILFVFLGGVLASFHWRWPFLIYLIAFAILPGVLWLVREPEPTRAPVADAASPRLRLGADTGLAFALICAMGFINMVAYFMVPVYLPFHLRGFENSSSVRVGLLLAVVGLAWGASSLTYRWVGQRLRHARILALGFGLSGGGLIALGLATDYPQACAALVLIGLGLGMNVPNFNAWLLSIVPAPVKGKAVGLLVCSVFLGQFFSPVLTQPIVAGAGIAHAYAVAGGAVVALAAAVSLIVSARAAPAARERAVSER